MTATDFLTATYPTAHVRGRRVVRSDGRPLGFAVLDAARAGYLGRERVGWLVAGHPGVTAAAAQLGRLDDTPGGLWVVVPYCKDLSAELWAAWPHPDRVSRRPTTTDPEWRSRRVWVSGPEGLADLADAAREHPGGVAGVVILDPHTILHKSRGFAVHGYQVNHDRPRLVCDFRAAVAVDDWEPPLILVTARPVGAVDHRRAAEGYALEAFEFVAGDTFACWEVPIEED